MWFDLLLLTFLNSLFCTGIYVASQFNGSDSFDDDPNLYRQAPLSDDRMILWWIRYYGSYFPKYFRKPLYECLPCMASIHSVPVYIFYCLIESVPLWYALLAWPVYVVALAGMNKVVQNALLSHD